MSATKQLQPVVTISNGKQLITTSKNLANVFGKPHKDVLETIRKLEVPEEFGRRNFPPSNYTDFQGKKQPMVEMTRDGFTILVMGFTGPKAMKFKLAYIEAFNQMEKELSAQNTLPAILDTEILKTLVATSQQILGLREQLGVLTQLQEYLAHFDETARTMNASVLQLTKLSEVESVIRNHINDFRNDFKKYTERTYQRATNDALGQMRIAGDIDHISSRLSAIETHLAEEDTARQGIMGYLETYLPKHETGVQTTMSMTPENDPSRFIREMCTVDPFSSVELTFLYKVYKAWALSNFAQALGPINFWEYLQEHLPEGVTMELRKSKRHIIGLKPVCDKLSAAGKGGRP